ncbi:MAG: hypothetical protein NTX82_01715 [Candidatus Parcubacteria bacterium]|nr:hypothetical protein [Candidatus Parcubacteria bacterium]
MRFKITDLRLQIKDTRFMILVILGIMFFFIYSFLIFGNSGHHFTWPDETANYFFINNYIEHSSFSVAEPLNKIAANLVKPRSFNVYQGNLVPGSFLGMLLIYGLIGKIVGMGLVQFLTPLLAVLAGIFFYKILLRLFEPKIAFISTILFYLNPAWWYYANFSMLPNIAFLSLLIIGIYYLLKIDKGVKQKNILYVILGSLFIALALTIRTNEFLWILGLVGFLLLVYRQKVKWQYILIGLAVLAAVFMPIFYYNQTTYGNFLSFGYLRLENGSSLTSQLPTEFKTAGADIVSFVKFLIMPFGIHPKTALISIYSYFVSLFWWLFVAGALGLVFFIKKYNNKEHAVYFLAAISVSLYLIIYYGSWVFVDLMTLRLNRIGISYVRYFLPVYIFTLPLAAIFYEQVINYFRHKKLRIILSLGLCLAIIYFSLYSLFFSGNDNLISIKQNIKDYNQINQKVIGMIEPNAVIISQRSDKIFFPERKVIGRMTIDDFVYISSLVFSGIPVYYYAFEDDQYLEDLSATILDFDITLSDSTTINEKERLFKIIYPYYGADQADQ